MKDFFGSLRRIGALFVLGVLLVICMAMGVVIFQQSVSQKELRDQLAKLTLTVNQPLASAEKLKADYEEVLNSTPSPDSKVLLEMIVGVASASGIDVNPETGKFVVPPQSVLQDAKVGDIVYQVVTFRDIKAQGTYEQVMSFIASLESGSVIKTGVVKSANLSVNKPSGSENLECIALITLDIYTRRKV